MAKKTQGVSQNQPSRYIQKKQFEQGKAKRNRQFKYDNPELFEH